MLMLLTESRSRAMVQTLSSESSARSLDPLAARPACLVMASARKRLRTPPWLPTSTSASAAPPGTTQSPASVSPSASLIPTTPWVRRPVSRNSDTLRRLPLPMAVTKMTSAPAAPAAASPPESTSVATMRSPSRSLAELTPRAVRPCTRTSDAEKHKTFPNAVANKMESASERVILTAHRRSSPWSLVAIRPERCTRAKFDSAVRFTKPSSVIIINSSSSGNSFTASMEEICSSIGSLGMRCVSGIPADVREDSGTLRTSSAYARPERAKRSSVSLSWHLLVCARPSLSRRRDPARPRVLRFCATNCAGRMRLMYPRSLSVMSAGRSGTSFSAATSASFSSSPSSLDRRGVPNSFLRSSVSLTSTSTTFASLARSPSNPAMRCSSSSASSWSLRSSSDVSRRSAIDSTPSACFSERPCTSWRALAALLPSGARRTVSTMASICAIARRNPATRCWRSRAAASDARARRRITSLRKSTKTAMASTSESVLGILSTMAIMLLLMRFWSGVLLKRAPMSASGSAFRLSCTTTRMPSRSLSSRTSATPSMSLALTRSLMRFTI
mmetsp:Transcript_21846/g.70562  ORF Transcript_21846/g.70562 Transcript_21846/m.70562 type:complete len:559 (-) Transcript_21846:847-2523(-)